MQGFTFDVFISHNAQDKPQVRRLAERLKAAGVRVWFDEWIIKPGDIISLKVDEGLEQSRVLLLCISRAALTSGWVALERSTAVHRDPANAARRFIPVIMEDCELPDTLRRYKYIDFRQTADAAMEELLTACKGDKELTSAIKDDLHLAERPINLGFDGAIDKGFPHGWFDSVGYVSGVSIDYHVRVTAREAPPGGRCLVIHKAEAEYGEFASVMQRFHAAQLAGKSVRLEGELKTEGVLGWAGFWLRADGENEPNLFFDNMCGHRVTGDSPWSYHVIEGRLPQGTVYLNIGIVFAGSGVVWADNLALRVWTREFGWRDV